MYGYGDTFCTGGDIKYLYDAEVGLIPKTYQPNFIGRVYVMGYNLSKIESL